MELDLSKISRDPDYLIELVAYLFELMQKQQEEIKWLKDQLRQRPPIATDEPGGQQLLFEEILAQQCEETSAAEDPCAAEDPSDGSSGEAKARGKRQPLPEHLEREDLRHELPGDERMCCEAVMVEIGEEITEQLDFEPARFVVRRHRRAKYACKV